MRRPGRDSLLPYVLSLILLLACGQGKPTQPQTDTVAIKKDTLWPPAFLALKQQFDTSGKIDQTIEIPIPTVLSILKNYDTTWYNSVNPVEFIKNKFGYFFIIKKNCIAGGTCATYSLLAFDNIGQFIYEKKVGKFMADEDFLVTFDYKLQGDSILITEEGDNDSTTTTKNHIRLTLDNPTFGE